MRVDAVTQRDNHCIEKSRMDIQRNTQHTSEPNAVKIKTWPCTSFEEYI